jgi:hypothetical protein
MSQNIFPVRPGYAQARCCATLVTCDPELASVASGAAGLRSLSSPAVPFTARPRAGEFLAGCFAARHDGPAFDAPPGVPAQPQRLPTHARTVIGYGGSFIPFTFPAASLHEIAGFGLKAVPWVLLPRRSAKGQGCRCTWSGRPDASSPRPRARLRPVRVQRLPRRKS